LILHVIDASEPLTSEDAQFLAELAAKKSIFVLNKIDLPKKASLPSSPAVKPRNAVSLSCATGAGLEDLKDAIRSVIWSGEIKAEMLEVMINSRHQQALSRAREALLRAIDGFNANQTLEVIAMDLRIAVNAVGEIVGKTTTEDILDMVFSQFCIGK
ncbi:MAG TPA: tRNA uridine-5-carboxymethylaminomethyl(34) synthesis GTPase MnmE, partial [Verrucomicrobiae bacterium]|nr:tRNA uridine-5-carboxymethylaminomethyl(34) synthesis GTPase MnmE [Verrucomicrobiae bacterium]